MFDFWGVEYRRFFQLETLKSAVTGTIELGTDRFIVPSIQSALGPSPIVSLHFELFQEGGYQLIFRIRAVNAAKKRGSFGLVVAKNAEECTDIATREHKHLQWLAERMKNVVVETFKGGVFYLPDRHGRKEKGRTIYAYVTRWLGQFHELGVRRDLSLFMNIDPPVAFSRANSEAIKRRIVEIVLRSYDHGQRTCMEMPQIASGDFVVSTSPDGPPKIKLIACRKLLTRMSPDRVIHRLLTAEWPWGDKTFLLAPSDPADIVQALHNALGKEQAAQWYAQYRQSIERKRLRDAKRHPIATLEPYFERT
jgi:hypothetical protein